MKEIKQYKCDYCGMVYNEKSRAEWCERNHKQVAKVVSAYYMLEGEYPNKIIVELTDGSTKIYTR